MSARARRPVRFLRQSFIYFSRQDENGSQSFIRSILVFSMLFNTTNSRDIFFILIRTMSPLPDKIPPASLRSRVSANPG